MASLQRKRAALVVLFAAQVLLSAVPSAAGAPAGPREAVYTDDWWADYHPTADVYELVKAVAAAHPDIVSTFSIGTTVEARSLLMAKVSDNVNTD